MTAFEPTGLVRSIEKKANLSRLIRKSGEQALHTKDLHTRTAKAAALEDLISLLGQDQEMT